MHLERVGWQINVAFFTLSGSALDINALSNTLAATMFLFVTRIMALFTGASVGSYLAGWPANHVRICWMVRPRPPLGYPPCTSAHYAVPLDLPSPSSTLLLL